MSFLDDQIRLVTLIYTASKVLHAANIRITTFYDIML